ncbi:class I adenylate-forming enzyme family protein [Halorientalis salina]|uniref:class I adenylate-forming enzyme family protein n=1 Tax=Halorientalis salina TaxID=2932266 RepID=UPI0010ACD3DC|nr:AMP-binding protein [Halorientalis salina]
MEVYQGEPLRHMGDLLAMAAHRYEDQPAFVSFGQTRTYGEVDTRANKVANVLVDEGVEPGDRVGLFVPNTSQFPESYFGAMRAGAVPVPLNLRMDPETLVYVVQNAEADHVIASPLLADEAQNLAAAAEVGTLLLGGVSGDGIVNYSHAIDDASGEFERVERAYDDVACQPYTSGTTGNPKGVLLTHENLLSTIEAYDNGGLAIDPEDNMLLVLPLFHIYALNAIMGSYIYNGGTMVLQPQPEAVPMLDAIEAHDITQFAGVPAMYTMMWREYRESPDEYDLSSLDEVTCAAAPLADEVRRTIEDAWDVPMGEGWGMTETSPAGTLEPLRGVRKEAGCIGPVLGDMDIKLVDPDTRETRISTDQLHPSVDDDIDFEDEDAVTGEIAIRGPNVFEGYFKLPQKTESVFDDEGFFYTEDIARVDEDGYFWMVDRADDMIIAGGENIYPAEVEDALYEHPDVAEAAVVGAPHEVKGEAPVAFVVLEGDSDLTERDLREFSLDHVASYAHPRRVFFVDELPRSATKKVQRYKLEEEVDERLDDPIQSTDEEL